MGTKSPEKQNIKSKINWALPNQKVSQPEFVDAIQDAEKGPFFTVQESMQHFEQWLKLRKSKL